MNGLDELAKNMYLNLKYSPMPVIRALQTSQVRAFLGIEYFGFHFESEDEIPTTSTSIKRNLMMCYFVTV